MDNKEHKSPHVHIEYGEFHAIMKKIIALCPIEGFQLRLRFDDGTEKHFDLKPYLHLPVFSILNDNHSFKRVVNHGYFIEWEGQGIDLSADTLWHEGK